MKRDALYLQSRICDFQKMEQDFNITYFREIGEQNIERSKDGRGNLKIIQLNKTYGAMTHFANAEDEDLQTIMRILEKIIVEIQDMES